MIQLLLMKYWKHAVLVAAVGVSAGLAYNHIYTKGYNEASEKYEQKFRDYELAVDKRIAKVTGMADALIESSFERNEIFAADIRELSKAIKGRQIYTIKQGKCEPTDDFIKAYNEAIARGNKK